MNGWAYATGALAAVVISALAALAWVWLGLAVERNHARLETARAELHRTNWAKAQVQVRILAGRVRILEDRIAVAGHPDPDCAVIDRNTVKMPPLARQALDAAFAETVAAWHSETAL